jgi:hypothetical protein
MADFSNGQARSLVSIRRYHRSHEAHVRAESAAMVGTFSLFCVAVGAAIARLSEKFPTRTELMETVAGILLLGGIAAIGCALPVML